MDITELKNDKLELELRVTLSENDLSKHIEKSLAEIAKTARMPGFRVGKVPASMLKKSYGASLRNEAVQRSAVDSVQNIIKDRGLKVISEPSFKDFVNKEGQGVEFTALFVLFPEVKMPDFSKVKLEKPVLEVSDKDIDSELTKIAEFYKSFDKPSKGAAKDGDQVTINAVGYVDDKAFDGGKLDEYKLVLGSKVFINGFEDQLIGVKAGVDIDVNVTFPKDYHAKDLADKPAVFKVHVVAVHKAVVPAIDDEFAKKLKVENVEDLRKKVSGMLKSSYDAPIHSYMKMSLFDKLEPMLTFDVPDSLVQRELQVLKSQASEFDQENDPELKGKSEQEKTDYFTKIAFRRVRIGLVLAEYAKNKHLHVHEDEVRNAIIAQMRSFPGQEKQIADYYTSNPKAAESLTGPILEDKSVNDIFANQIKITEKTYSREKLEKLLD